MFLNTSRTRVNKNNLSWWYILKTSWKYLCMSWRRLQHVLKTFLQVVLKTFWRRLEDVFCRSKAEANIFVLFKTSWRCLEDVFWRQRRKTSSRRMFAGWFLSVHPENILKRSENQMFFYVFSFKANQPTGFHVTTTLVFNE